jgi:myo-inositol-1(or 4)-monophosphatase
MSDTPSTATDHAELDRRADFCRELALSAGALALQGFVRRDVETIEMKGPQNFLTETDAAVERHISGRIAETFPDDGFLGEETGGRIRPLTWVVDPIDGTANFARGIGHFCIAIAVVTESEIEIGAIYNPVADELHFARRGRGATLNSNPIAVSHASRFDAACVELGWSNRVPNEAYLTALARLLDLGANVRRSASGALGLAYVSDGRSDAYAELHMNAWDCLAGLLLVSEAGGLVAPFLRNDGLAKGGAVLASAPGIAEEISKAIGIPLQAEPGARSHGTPGADRALAGPALSGIR